MKFFKRSKVGKNVVLVANLAPVTLCGVESHGMILACGEESPKVVFLSDETKPGERISGVQTPVKPSAPKKKSDNMFLDED